MNPTDALDAAPLSLDLNHKETRMTHALTIGAIAYPFDLSMNAMCDLEEAFDMGIYRLAGHFADQNAVRAGDVRKLIGVVARNPDGTKLAPGADVQITNAAGPKACYDAAGAYLAIVLAGGEPVAAE